MDIGVPAANPILDQSHIAKNTKNYQAYLFLKFSFMVPTAYGKIFCGHPKFKN